MEIPLEAARDAAEAGLKEDVGRGDVTTEALIPRGAVLRAVIRAESEGVVAGMRAAEEVFRILDENIVFKTLIKDGERAGMGSTAAELEGSARAILTGERTALNILGRLSGIATAAAAFSGRVKKFGVKIMDTRKTVPGLRALEKYAVSAGGGVNHRMGLYDAVLIKDNHVEASGLGTGELIRIARSKTGGAMKIEAEVSSIAELKEALQALPDIILLDNMDPENVRKSVAVAREKAPAVLLEVSGGITLENLEEYAACGVDMISSGALTHSVRNFDFSLEAGRAG